MRRGAPSPPPPVSLLDVDNCARLPHTYGDLPGVS